MLIIISSIPWFSNMSELPVICNNLNEFITSLGGNGTIYPHVKYGEGPVFYKAEVTYDVREDTLNIFCVTDTRGTRKIPNFSHRGLLAKDNMMIFDLEGADVFILYNF